MEWKKTLLIILVTSSTFLTVSAQSNLVIRIEDHFINNSQKWAEHVYSTGSAKIEREEYVIECTTEKSYSSWKKFLIDTTKDFILSCKTTWLDGVRNHAYGLMFGRSEQGNYYCFGIDGMGSYVFYKYENGESKNIISWTKSDFINKEGMNQVKIIKQGNSLHFFINNNFVNQSTFSEFYGSYVGFIVANKQKIAFDDFLIGWGGSYESSKK